MCCLLIHESYSSVTDWLNHCMSLIMDHSTYDNIIAYFDISNEVIRNISSNLGGLKFSINVSFPM